VADKSAEGGLDLSAFFVSPNIKNQNAKCEIKELIAAKRQFHNFDFLVLIF